jgi:hypothetical protein
MDEKNVSRICKKTFYLKYFLELLLNEICRLDRQNHPKIIETPNQLKKNENFPKKKYVLVSKKCKGAKNPYGNYPTEFTPEA